MPHFERYTGIDFSGAETPDSSFKGLRILRCRRRRHAGRTRMNILEMIRGWQIRARSTTPPEGTDILPARGGLPGPAFFPEGFGLQNPPIRRIVAGHHGRWAQLRLRGLPQ